MRIVTKQPTVKEQISDTLRDWADVRRGRWEELDYIELCAEDYWQLMSELDLTECSVHPNYVIVKLRHILKGWGVFGMMNFSIKIQKRPEGRPLMVPGEE